MKNDEWWAKAIKVLMDKYNVEVEELATRLGSPERTVRGVIGGWKKLPYPARLNALEMLNRLEDWNYALRLIDDSELKAFFLRRKREPGVARIRINGDQEQFWRSIDWKEFYLNKMLSEQMVRKIKNGIRNVPARVKCKAADELGIAVDEAFIESVLPEWLMKCDKRKVRAVIQALAVH